MSNSIVLAGTTSSYLTVPYNSNLSPGSSDFTIEWWQYMTVNRVYPRIFQMGGFAVSIETTGAPNKVFYYWKNGSWITNFEITPSPLNRWVNFSISKSGGTVYIFQDGVLKRSVVDNTAYTNPSNANMLIGNSLTDNDASYGGSLYGFNYEKGVGKYTSNYTVPTVYPTVNSNTILLLSYNNYYYSLGTVTATGVTSGSPAPGIVVLCFLEGTKILSENDKEIPIEQLKKGSLVKTITKGYLPIKEIKSRKFKNSYNSDAIDRLFCIKDGENELILTGGHSLLVDYLTQDHLSKMFPLTNGLVYMTENKMRLFSCFSEKAFEYPEGNYTIWHFSLEDGDENEELNYGIWANGILAETCSKKSMQEF